MSAQIIISDSYTYNVDHGHVAIDVTAWSSDDVLVGGKGNDLLQGGTSNDIYRFSRGFGKDRINNLDTTSKQKEQMAFS